MRLLEFNEFINRTDISIDELAKIISDKFYYSKCKYLASGGEGVAYEVSDNKIMKITNSKLEAKTAEILNHWSYQYIANIYTVRKLKPTGKYKLMTDKCRGLRQPYINELYVIFVEKLFDTKKASNIILSIYDNSDELFKPDNIINKSYGYYNKFIKNINKLDDNDKYLYGNTKEEIINCYNQLTKINNDLNNAGIKSSDAHIENFGFKIDGNLAIFDVQDKRLKSDVKSILDI